MSCWRRPASYKPLSVRLFSTVRDEIEHEQLLERDAKAFMRVAVREYDEFCGTAVVMVPHDGADELPVAGKGRDAAGSAGDKAHYRGHRGRRVCERAGDRDRKPACQQADVGKVNVPPSSEWHWY